MKILKLDGMKNFNYPKPIEGYDFRTVDEFYDLNNISESTCSEEYIEEATCRYFSRNWQWGSIIEQPMKGHIFYVNEMIDSMNSDLFIKKLKQYFGKEILFCGFDNTNPSKKDIIRIIFCDDNSIVDSSCIGGRFLLETRKANELYDFIEKHNYYITYIIKNEKRQIEVYLEPCYTKSLSEYFKEHMKYVYHITDTKNVETIKKVGLRPRVGKTKNENSITGYRYFPERVFYIGACDTKQETINNLIECIILLGKRNYTILSINIQEHDIAFWEDRASTNIKNAAYNYIYIPKSLIEGYAEDVNDILFEKI